MSGPAKGATLVPRFSVVQCLAQPGHVLKRSEDQGPWSGKGQEQGKKGAAGIRAAALGPRPGDSLAPRREEISHG